MNYAEAKKRVEDIKGFYIHFLVYAIFTGMFFLISYFTGGHWAIYPAIIWGAAILIHGATLLFEKGIFGKEWEEKKIKELMAKSG